MKSFVRSVMVSVGVASLLGLTSVCTGCSSDEGKPSVSLDGGAVDDSDGSADSGTAPGAKKKLGESPCATNEDCESNVCFAGNGQPPFCTLACTEANGATVCVAPLTATCNKKGFCKRD